MKPRKTTFEERLEIDKWMVENDMNYKSAANKYSISYARVYKWSNEYIKMGRKLLNLEYLDQN